jgi:sorbitol/mannitol transport system substrate-binding protein
VHSSTEIGKSLTAAALAAHAETELVIATVNNGHMIEMQKLTPAFEKAHPQIKLKWVTLARFKALYAGLRPLFSWKDE